MGWDGVWTRGDGVVMVAAVMAMRWIERVEDAKGLREGRGEGRGIYSAE